MSCYTYGSFVTRFWVVFYFTNNSSRRIWTKTWTLDDIFQLLSETGILGVSYWSTRLLVGLRFCQIPKLVI
jgi:hypothetical protein